MSAPRRFRTALPTTISYDSDVNVVEVIEAVVIFVAAVLSARLFPTTHTCVLAHNSHKSSQFSSKMGTGLTKDSEVGVELHL